MKMIAKTEQTPGTMYLIKKENNLTVIKRKRQLKPEILKLQRFSFFSAHRKRLLFSVFGCQVANESNKTSGKSSEMLRDDDSCYNLVVISFTC